jgi:hypothetical protein
MSHAKHINGFVFGDKKDSMLAENEMPNVGAELSALRRKRTTSRGIFPDSQSPLSHRSTKASPCRANYRAIQRTASFMSSSASFSTTTLKLIMQVSLHLLECPAST